MQRHFRFPLSSLPLAAAAMATFSLSLPLARKQNQTTFTHTQTGTHTQAHLSATQIFQRRGAPVITGSIVFSK